MRGTWIFCLEETLASIGDSYRIVFVPLCLICVSSFCWDIRTDETSHSGGPVRPQESASAAVAAATTTTGKSSSTTTPSANKNNTHTTTPARGALQRRTEYAVRPGYSSGASSYDGSLWDGDTDHEDDDNDTKDLDTSTTDHPSKPKNDNDLRTSRHSDILALSTLRQELVADGDLTKTVVRIEVRMEDACVCVTSA